MRGRFTLRTLSQEFAELFGISGVPSPPARDNIASTQPAWAAVQRPEPLQLVFHESRWGLIPSWADAPSFGARTSNARSETAAEIPAFRSAGSARRRLIPADGFFAWRALGCSRRP